MLNILKEVLPDDNLDLDSRPLDLNGLDFVTIIIKCEEYYNLLRKVYY